MSADEQKLLVELERNTTQKILNLLAWGVQPLTQIVQAMRDFCQALYLLKEFIFLP